MIKTEYCICGVRWHCTNCDTGHTQRAEGVDEDGVRWFIGPPPKVCLRCEPHKEYRIKLDFQVLLPEENEARVREAIDKVKVELAEVVRTELGGRDAQLSKWTVRGPYFRMIQDNPTSS